MSMLSKDSVVRLQYPDWNSNIVETTRNGFTSSSHTISSSNPTPTTDDINTSTFPQYPRLNEQQTILSSIPNPHIIQHDFEPQHSHRRLPGTFEYGYTYGSSTYRHDQSVFLGTPRLHTRYQPEHVSHRQFNGAPSEIRRRQFSPFMQLQKYTEKCERDANNGITLSNNNRPAPKCEESSSREFPVNHDWDKTATVLHEPPSPTVYLTCALVIWSVNGYYGFLCDRNSSYGNLHFYADSTTTVKDKDNKTLGELPDDCVLRGHRVEIEAEFIDPDLSDPDIHHLIYVRKLLKLGTEISLQLIKTQYLIPLTKKKPAPFFRTLSESGDLVYVHPSILLATSLIESMKSHLPSVRPLYVELTRYLATSDLSTIDFHIDRLSDVKNTRNTNRVSLSLARISPWLQSFHHHDFIDVIRMNIILKGSPNVAEWSSGMILA